MKFTEFNKYLVLIILCVSGNLLHAQWNCRSRMGAFLKPAGSSNLMWATELEGSQGYITNSNITSAMFFGALNYSTASSTFYVEGGVKYWRQDDKDENLVFDNSRFGFREAFYQYKQSKNQFSLGLKSSALSDGYLLNERVLGVNYKYEFNGLKLQAVVGTVSKDFARNGTFCSTCYLYDIIPGRDLSSMSAELGKNNLAALSVSFLPQKKSSEADSSSEEFGSMDDFGSSPSVYFDEIGWVGYTEFGDAVDNNLFTTGLFCNLILGKQFSFKPEVLLQLADNNNALIYSLKLQKDLLWNNGHKTGLSAHYYDFSEMDNGAGIMNSFSNILAGEVLRLDAAELPVFLVGVKHMMPKQKLHFKCQYVWSDHYSSLQEVDFQVGKIFFDRLQTNLITGYVDSDLIPDEDHAVLGRLELRLNF